MLKHLPIAFLCLFLASCNGLFPEARSPDRRFVLNAPAIEKATPGTSTMEIALPQVNAGLGSQRIALLKNTHEVDYFAGARWADNLPEMVQGLLVEAFEHQGVIKAVGNDTVGMAPDVRLVVELRHFEAIYDKNMNAPPQIRVEMVAKLFREPDHEWVWTGNYNETEMAADNQLSAIVPAFDAAFGRATKTLVAEASKAAK